MASIPAGQAANCLLFENEAALQARKAEWVNRIQALPTAQQANWLVGIQPPLLDARKEAENQRDCLLAAARQAVAGLPGQLIYSGYRDFNHQKAIWLRKYAFQGGAFSRISTQARQICPDLLFANESLWQPQNPRHRQCWLGQGRLPAGHRALTPDERQQEILQASSAPGTSRHHWGSDFDLFDPQMNPENWQAGQRLYPVYQWLLKNARHYGFFQPYKATAYPGGRAYMEERWHWSYYPVAQALLTTLKKQPAVIESALIQHWGDPQPFSYIRQHWRDYVEHVDEQ